MPMDQFSQHLLPSLLSLSSDPVANVRVLVAKALRQSVMEKGTVTLLYYYITHILCQVTTLN